MPIINQKIRVLVVDDSMVARGMIMQGLSAHPRIEVIGYAINWALQDLEIEEINALLS